MSGVQSGRGRLTVVQTASPGSARRASRTPQPKLQRARLIASMTALSRERDWHGLSVDRICEHAGMSRRTFYEHFTDAEDCFAGAIEDALQHLWDVVAEQVDAVGDDWAEQVAVAIVAFLAALELDAPRAWMAIMEPLYGNSRARAARQVVVDRFVALLGSGRPTTAAIASPPTPRRGRSAGSGSWRSSASPGARTRWGSTRRRGRRSSSRSHRSSDGTRRCATPSARTSPPSGRRHAS
jgi:AcrR family transcriptional regulator